MKSKCWSLVWQSRCNNAWLRFPIKLEKWVIQNKLWEELISNLKKAFVLPKKCTHTISFFLFWLSSTSIWIRKLIKQTEDFHRIKLTFRLVWERGWLNSWNFHCSDPGVSPPFWASGVSNPSPEGKGKIPNDIGRSFLFGEGRRTKH